MGCCVRDELGHRAAHDGAKLFEPKPDFRFLCGDE